jgi:uncharacterized repeat protein (TIGR01451 family)
MQGQRKKKFKYLKPTLLVLFALVLSFAYKQPEVAAAPQTFTVTNTNVSGPGSFSQAIIDANSNGNPTDQDVIEFNIGGVPPYAAIIPNSQIEITEPVLVNGFTQPNSSPNTEEWPLPMNSILRVEIELINAGTLNIRADNVELRGLAINSSAEELIDVYQVSGFKLNGSYLNTDYTGVHAKSRNGSEGNHSASTLLIRESTGVGIGELNNPAYRNVIGECESYCVDIQNSSAISIDNNYINIAADWLTTHAVNTQGNGVRFVNSNNIQLLFNAIDRLQFAPLLIESSNNLTISGNRLVINGQLNEDSYGDIGENCSICILGSSNITFGGENTEEGNIISANSSYVSIADSLDGADYSTNIIFQNNRVGVDTDTDDNMGNNNVNFYVRGNSSYVSFQDNIIANSKVGGGVWITGNADDVSLISNSIYNNAQQGIDINANNTKDVNDTNDTDTGPNGQLNHPEWISFSEENGDTDVTFQTDLQAGEYRIEFFSNSVPDSPYPGEGEVFLGYVNVTSNGSGIQLFNDTLSGITGVQNLTLTATEIDGSSPTGFGATSEFGGEYTPSPGLGISKTLDNPEDFVQGGTVNYTVTITNDGDTSLDLTELDGGDFSNPLAQNLFVDFLPPGMSLDSVVSGDVNCFSPPGQLGDLSPIFGNHASYSALFCAYSGGLTDLAPQSSISITLAVLISEEASLNYANMATSGWVALADPGVQVGSECFGLVTEQQDWIDCLLANRSNGADIAFAGAPTDVSVSKTLIAPNGVDPGDEVSYELNLTNNGPGDVNLAWYADFNRSEIVFADAFPSGLSFVNTESGDGIGCLDVGPGTAGFVPLPHDNQDGNLVVCAYFAGDSRILASGESVSVTINAVVNNGTTDFTNYAFHISTPSDIDMPALQSIEGYEDYDWEENIFNNFARAVYSAQDSGDPDPEDPDTNNPGSGDGQGDDSSGGENNGGTGNGGRIGSSGGNSLSATGENLRNLSLVAAILLVGGSIGMLVLRRKRRS